MNGSLFLLPTPIGNLEDITIRTIKTLFTLQVLLCEDTRYTGQLLKELKDRYSHLLDEHATTPRLIRYYDEIEDKRIPEIIALLQEGTHVGLVSDNGTPTISDPGYRLVRECIKRSITIISLPGPNAAITALTSSGLPTDSFLFIGFLPEKEGPRKAKLHELKQIRQFQKTTYIAYCSPHKLPTTLQDMGEIYGVDHPIVITRELTKIYEEVWRGTVQEALGIYSLPKGEFVLLWSFLTL